MEIEFTGTSMLPTLRAGCKVIVDQSKSFEIGDILFGWQDERFVAHRLLKIGLTKGDRSGCFDGDFTPMGKVVGFKDESGLYLWGDRGQPFKKIIAGLSRYTTFSHPRFIRKIFLLLISFFSIWKKTRKNHK